MDDLSKSIRKNLWYLDQEGFMMHELDGSMRWKTQEEMDDAIRLFGGDPETITKLIFEVLSMP